MSSLDDGPGNDDNSPHFASVVYALMSLCDCTGLLLIELSSIGSLCFWQLLIMMLVCVCWINKIPVKSLYKLFEWCWYYCVIALARKRVGKIQI